MVPIPSTRTVLGGVSRNHLPTGRWPPAEDIDAWDKGRGLSDAGRGTAGGLQIEWLDL